jgi:hypothetical protein
MDPTFATVLAASATAARATRVPLLIVEEDHGDGRAIRAYRTTYERTDSYVAFHARILARISPDGSIHPED